MADMIVTGTSNYATGSIDSATVLISNVSTISARHPNGIASGVVQIETILGSGTALKGTHADLVARLAVALGANGKVELGDPSKLTGILNVVNGGTSLATLPQHRVLVGNTTGLPIFSAGLLFQGPTSIGAGSTLSHGGAVALIGAQSLNGIHFYSSFTHALGTISLGASGHRLVIVASDSISLSGVINAAGSGGSGGAGGAGSGQNGSTGQTLSSQPGGGGGGGSTTFSGGTGGGVLSNGITIVSGGSGGGVGGGGGVGSTVGGTGLQFSSPYAMYGGSGGGGGAGDAGDAGGNGGAGGGIVILIAPTITLAAGSSINTSGSAGNTAQFDAGGGGGGGAGNIFMFCRSFTDGGCTFTQNGGAGGSANRSGGAGAAGIRQIFIYG